MAPHTTQVWIARGLAARSAPQRTAPFVVGCFEDHDWPVWPTKKTDKYLCYQDSFIRTTAAFQRHWNKNPKLRNLMERLKDSNNLEAGKTISGKGFVAVDKITGNRFPIMELQMLPTGVLRVMWPMVLRNTVNVKNHVIKCCHC